MRAFEGDRAKKKFIKKIDDPTFMPVGRSTTECAWSRTLFSHSRDSKSPLTVRYLPHCLTASTTPPSLARSPHNMMHWGTELRTSLQPRKCEEGGTPWGTSATRLRVRVVYTLVVQVPYM